MDARNDAIGRVEMWRSGCRLNISVSAPFVWRCLSGSAVTPFPHPAHRTGHADLPHPALGQDVTPSPTARLYRLLQCTLYFCNGSISTHSRCSRHVRPGAPLARTRGKWQREGQRGPYGADLSMPRVGDDPVARGECRRRGGRMIDRPERPSSSVRPEPDSAKKKHTCSDRATNSPCWRCHRHGSGGERLDLHSVAEFS